MTGYESKKKAALDEEGMYLVHHTQPAQEPVVFYRCNGCGHAYEQVHPTSCDCMKASGFHRVEYYTTPPQPAQEPICPECKAGVLYECVACSSNNYPQPAQEAVAWCPVCGDKGFPWPKCGHITYFERATPPQRTWVGLTDEERSQLVTLHHGWNEYAQAIEAKLKEKNNA